MSVNLNDVRPLLGQASKKLEALVKRLDGVVILIIQVIDIPQAKIRGHKLGLKVRIPALSLEKLPIVLQRCLEELFSQWLHPRDIENVGLAHLRKEAIHGIPGHAK